MDKVEEASRKNACGVAMTQVSEARSSGVQK